MDGKKRPMVKSWLEYTKRFATDEEIARWAAAGHNIAVVCGKISGVVVADHDTHQVPARAADFPETATQQTSRGWHWVFKWPGYHVANTTKKRFGFEIRGDHGYFLVEPSVNAETGVVYTWTRRPEDGIAAAPDWLFAPPNPAPVSEPSADTLTRWLAGGATQGERNVAAASVAGWLIRGVTSAERETRVWPILQAWNRLNQPPLGEHETDQKDALRVVFESITRKEQHKPRRVPGPKIGGGVMMDKKIDPLKWIVGTILPSGLTVFAGRPKSGKSWLALKAAFSVAAGLPLWHEVPTGSASTLGDLVRSRSFGVAPGKVLYLALEDSLLRVQTRLRMVWEAYPEVQQLTLNNIDFRFEWPSLKDGGADHIQTYIDENSDLKLIVVDTMRAMHGGSQVTRDIVQSDYDNVMSLEKLVKDKGIALLAVDHLNKPKAGQGDDIFDRVLGTTGVTSAVDNMWALVKKDQAGVFWVKGRDIEAMEFNLQWDEQTSWEMLSDRQAAKESGKDIIAVLADAREPLSLGDISDRTGTSRTRVKQAIWRMVKSKRLVKSGYGKQIRFGLPEWGRTSDGVVETSTEGTPEPRRRRREGAVVGAANRKDTPARRGDGVSSEDQSRSPLLDRSAEVGGNVGVDSGDSGELISPGVGSGNVLSDQEKAIVEGL